ncbi:MAG: ABC transporter ATP-binding protein [Candidatus Saccharibacteria bacterium]
MIECKNLTLIYKDGHKENLVLDGVNLQVQNNETIVLLGPSGSGKSSLIYLLSGLKKPTSGQIIYDGVDIEKFNKKQFSDLRRQKFGYIFQQHFLIPYLTVMENVLVGAPKMGKACRNKAEFLLHELGIDQYIDKSIFELSGGERQRVAIARALISEPEVIFADEPTASLDHKTAAEILKLIKKYKESTTLIIATHDTSILEGDESIVRIDHGKVIRDN